MNMIIKNKYKHFFDFFLKKVLTKKICSYIINSENENMFVFGGKEYEIKK